MDRSISKYYHIAIVLIIIINALSVSAFADQNIQDHKVFAESLQQKMASSFSPEQIENTRKEVLTPNQKDREFVEKNKNKYKFLSNDEILDISREKYSDAIKTGKTEDVSAIHHKDLASHATAKSLNKNTNQDRSHTMTSEYFDIATRSSEHSRKYKKDLEEKQIKEALLIVKDPYKTLKKRFKIDLECQEEELSSKDVQESLVPKIDHYKFNISTKDTKEEHKQCEEAEPVPFQCQRRLTPTCKRIKECDDGGIVVGSIKQNDMTFRYTYPELTIGTIADNYWGGYCQVYDRTTTFKIRNLAKIKEFRISQVGFDDYLWIKVNGKTVYVGPYGGDRVELKGDGYLRGVTTNGHDHHSCELKTDWNVVVNIDLRPYLRDDAENEIWTRVVVAGRGEGWMKIIARQDCCDQWEDVWDGTCENELKAFR